MKAFILIVLAGVVACKNVDRSLPSFVWQNEESPFGVPILKIKFQDGGDDDSALLRKYNPVPVGPMERSDSVDDCIYNGFLSKESDVHVTVTGCAMSNNFQVQFSSRRLANDMFKVTNGVVNSLSQNSRNLEIEPFASKTLKKFRLNRDLPPLNPNGYIVNIKTFYDDNFKDRFGSDVTNAIRRILAHTQHVWKWPTLTTKVIFKVSPDVKYIPERWSANDSLSTKSKPYATDPAINSHMFFTTRDPKASYSTLGKGYRGGACDSELYLHALLMEYQYDDITFARSLAHELGHNLNFDHDFYDDDKTKPQQPRFDSKKRPCTGIGSIMDYAKGGQGDKRQWSTCSVEDMQEMIDEFPTCLKVIDPSNPPTEIGDQPITSHECNLNKVKPGLNGYDISNLNGFECTILCIEGICAPTTPNCENRDKTACQNICGTDNCDQAVKPSLCDLSSFGFDGGKRWFCSTFGKVLVVCSKGLCRPSDSALIIGGYQNSCMKICGQSSCNDIKNRC